MIKTREQLVNRMRIVFGSDQKRINHALSVLDYAEQIQSVEGGDSLVVNAAAILHDIGIHQAEQKYGSAAGKYQEIEGPPIARDILQNFDLDEQTIEHIIKIIANHHSAKEIDTLEFRVIWDADWLVNLQDESLSMSHDQWKERINRIFKTNTGRQLAFKTFTL